MERMEGAGPEVGARSEEQDAESESMNGQRMQDPGMGGAGHLDAKEVAAYVDGTLPVEQRPKLESHLADCDPCREDVVAVRRSVRGAHRRAGRRLIPLAVAAGLAGILAVGILSRGTERADETVYREGTAALQEGSPLIEVVQPKSGGTLYRDAARFTWRPVEPDVFYRFTLTDTVGDVLWRGETRDTTLTLASEVALRPGDEYFWYVDTLLESGASATTDIVGFRVAPDAR